MYFGIRDCCAHTDLESSYRTPDSCQIQNTKGFHKNSRSYNFAVVYTKFIQRLSVFIFIYTVNSLLSPLGGLIDFKYSKGGLLKMGLIREGDLINILKIFNSQLNICCLKIKNSIHIV